MACGVEGSGGGCRPDGPGPIGVGQDEGKLFTTVTCGQVGRAVAVEKHQRMGGGEGARPVVF